MTNELKCPVCGEGLAIDGLHCLCTSMYCKAEGVHLPQDYVVAVNEAINKEKAAAVQEERERIIGIIKNWGEQVEDLVDVKHLIKRV